MLEKFTEKAKRILFLARYEASQTGSKVIGTEHMLLGIIKENEDITAELFARSNINVELLRGELEARGPSRERTTTSVEIPFSDEVKRVLSFAEEEAERLLHPSIGTEHLLLGLLRSNEGLASSVLGKMGITSEQVRRQTRRILQESSTSRTTPSGPVDTNCWRNYSTH